MGPNPAIASNQGGATFLCATVPTEITSHCCYDVPPLKEVVIYLELNLDSRSTCDQLVFLQARPLCHPCNLICPQNYHFLHYIVRLCVFDRRCCLQPACSSWTKWKRLVASSWALSSIPPTAWEYEPLLTCTPALSSSRRPTATQVRVCEKLHCNGVCKFWRDRTRAGWGKWCEN